MDATPEPAFHKSVHNYIDSDDSSDDGAPAAAPAVVPLTAPEVAAEGLAAMPTYMVGVWLASYMHHFTTGAQQLLFIARAAIRQHQLRSCTTGADISTGRPLLNGMPDLSFDKVMAAVGSTCEDLFVGWPINLVVHNGCAFLHQCYLGVGLASFGAADTVCRFFIAPGTAPSQQQELVRGVYLMFRNMLLAGVDGAALLTYLGDGAPSVEHSMHVVGMPLSAVAGRMLIHCPTTLAYMLANGSFESLSPDCVEDACQLRAAVNAATAEQ